MSFDRLASARRHTKRFVMKYEVRIGDRSFKIEIDGVAPDYALVIDGRAVRIAAERLRQPQTRLRKLHCPFDAKS